MKAGGGEKVGVGAGVGDGKSPPPVRRRVVNGDVISFPGGRGKSLVQRMAESAPRSIQEPEGRWSSVGDRLYPLPGGETFSSMANLVLTSSMLSIGTLARASMAVDSGYYVERVPSEGQASERVSNSLLRWVGDHTKWRAGGGTGGLTEVIRQFMIDRLWFGAGFLEILPPSSKYGTKSGSRSSVAGVAHLPRMSVRMLRPSKKVFNVGGRKVERYDPLDLIYPMLAYSSSGVTSGRSALTYIKAFGDERKINASTGLADRRCSWDEEATSYVRLRNYVPGFEEGCPEWWSALSHIDTIDAVTEYFRHVLRNNGVPDLMVVLKGGTIDKDYVRKMENKFRQLSQKRRSEGNYVNIIVWHLANDDLVDDADDLDDYEPAEMDMSWERLNPIDGNVVRSLADLRKRDELQVASSLRIPAQLLNFERNTGIGSGAEISAAIHLVVKLVIGPDQTRINSILDRIVRDGRNISEYRLRLEQPSYNDPMEEAKMAKMWSMVSGLHLDEIRDKIGLGSLRDAMKHAPGNEVDIGKVVLVPNASTAISLHDMELMAAGVYGNDVLSDKSSDAMSLGEGLPDGDAKDSIKALFDEWFAGEDEPVTKEKMAAILRDIRSSLVESFESLGVKVEDSVVGV